MRTLKSCRLAKTSTLTHLLSFLATAIVVCGVLASYYPHILKNSLPDNWMVFIGHNSWMATSLLVFGVTLKIIAILVNINSQPMRVDYAK